MNEAVRLGGHGKRLRNRLNARLKRGTATGAVLYGAMLALPSAASAQTACTQPDGTPCPTGIVLTQLPAPVGGSSPQSIGITADGSTVGGFYFDPASVKNGFVTWENDTPTVVVAPTTPGTPTFIDNSNVFSASGNAIATASTGQHDRYFTYWSKQSGLIVVTSIPGVVNPDQPSFAQPLAVSGDGNKVLIREQLAQNMQVLGCIWTPAGSCQALPALTTTPGSQTSYTNYSTMNRDASLFAGYLTPDLGAIGETSPFVYSSAGGFKALATLPSAANMSTYIPEYISADSQTIVGYGQSSDGKYNPALMWNNGSVTALPLLSPGGSSDPAGVSGNGSVVVGTEYNNGALAWRWSALTGTQSLNSILANANISVGGCSLNYAAGISDDARYITGNAEGAGGEYNSACGAFVLQLAQITRSQLIVQITLPGVTMSSIVNQSFATAIDGTLNGTSVVTRTVSDTIDSPTGIAAVAAVRAQLSQSSGLRRINVVAPTFVSSATTILGTTNNTTNLVTDTQTTTATVSVVGPASVVTGDRGVCATAASNGVNPTGCSLPGTPVAISPGILNSNIYTNTIQSVTPQTTQTVNQLVTSRWLIAATAGNQFGTSHALVGRAVFDRTDRMTRSLLDGMPSNDAQGSPMSASNFTGNPEATASGRWRVFGAVTGEWGTVSADPSIPVARVQTRTSGLLAGMEGRIGDGVTAGAAVETGTTNMNVRDLLAPETMRLNFTQGAAYLRLNSGRMAGGLLAALGGGDVSTGIVTPNGVNTAKRNTVGVGLAAQLGYAVVDGDTTLVRLVGGARYSAAKLNAFTETGGVTPLSGIERWVTRTRVYAGTEVATALNIGGLSVMPRLYVRGARDFGVASGIADVVFAGTTGPVYRAYAPGASRWSTETGGALDFRLGRNISLGLAYDGHFQRGARDHAAKALFLVRW